MGRPASLPAEQPTGPKVVTVQHKGGLRGLVEEIWNALSPKTTSVIHTDKDGNQTVVQDPLSSAQRWMHFAAQTARGAAAGYAAGQGPGGGGRAAVAGFKAGEEGGEQELQKQRDLYNTIKVRMDIAKNESEMNRRKITATDDDITFANNQEDRQRKMGSSLLGTYQGMHDLPDVAKTNPRFWQQAITEGRVVPIPKLNEKGERIGTQYWLEREGMENQIAPPEEQKFYTLEPGEKPGDDPRTVEHKPSEPMTWGELGKMNASYWKLKQEQSIANKNDQDKDTAEKDAQRYRQINTDILMNKKVPPEDIAWMKSYDKQKNIGAQFKIDNRTEQGNWQIAEDGDGHPILFNSKTKETSPVPEGGVEKAGTHDKTVGAIDAAVNYANTYVDSGKYTGAGDAALITQFIGATKAAGSRAMNRQQMDLVIKARGLMDSAEALKLHAETGRWLTDQQVHEMRYTMNAIRQARPQSPGSTPSGGAGAGGEHPFFKQFGGKAGERPQ